MRQKIFAREISGPSFYCKISLIKRLIYKMLFIGCTTAIIRRYLFELIHDKRGREQKKLFLLLTCKVHCATSSLECLLFSTCNSRLPYYRKLTPVSQMEVGCSRIWGLTPTTQTQVGGTPHKPALPATQPRAPLATPDPKSSTRHTEQ